MREVEVGEGRKEGRGGVVDGGVVEGGMGEVRVFNGEGLNKEGDRVCV